MIHPNSLMIGMATALCNYHEEKTMTSDRNSDGSFVPLRPDAMTTCVQCLHRDQTINSLRNENNELRTRLNEQPLDDADVFTRLAEIEARWLALEKAMEQRIQNEARLITRLDNACNRTGR